MIKVILVEPNGEINSVCSPSDDTLYVDGSTYGECVAHVVPFDTDTTNLHLWYWDGSEFKKDKPPYAGPWYTWSNNQWELDKVRLDDEIRARRDVKLSSTDFTQLADAVLPTNTTVADWQVYRQALRDLTLNIASVTNVDDVIWPTKP